MIGMCTKCGSYEWNMEVEGNRVKCPQCGNTWEYRQLPLFILTGCSGIGKTTAAKEMIRRKLNFVVLDADIFHNIMPHETDGDYYEQVEQLQSLSKNIMQSGMPVLRIFFVLHWFAEKSCCEPE